MTQENLKKLRAVINESLRVQRGGADPVPYIDASNVLTDVEPARTMQFWASRVNRGKTLLLHHSADDLPMQVRSVYLNCKDFKKHSFPNVLIEILDALLLSLKNSCLGGLGEKDDLAKLLSKFERSYKGCAKRQIAKKPKYGKG